MTGSPLTLGGERQRSGSESQTSEVGGRSRVDILVATPGRLIDHLKYTEGFTLQHLELLVVDEADRLVSQNYQNWTAVVLNAVRSGPAGVLTMPLGTHACSVARTSGVRYRVCIYLKA